jgi:hypothetical protein
MWLSGIARSNRRQREGAIQEFHPVKFKPRSDECGKQIQRSARQYPTSFSTAQAISPGRLENSIISFSPKGRSCNTWTGPSAVDLDRDRTLY